MTEQPSTSAPRGRDALEDRLRGLSERASVPAPAPEGISKSEWIALGLSLAWLALVGLFFLFMEPAANTGLLSSVMTLVGVFLPIAMIWIAAILARIARQMRTEAMELRQSVGAMRQAWGAQQTNRAVPSGEKLEEIVRPRARRKPHRDLASRRDAQARCPQRIAKPPS